MARPVYRKGKEFRRRAAILLRLANCPELTARQDRYLQALARQLQETLTAREVQCLTCYYVRKQNMETSAQTLGINPSTVSRNIARGSRKLERLLEMAEEISPLRWTIDAEEGV